MRFFRNKGDRLPTAAERVATDAGNSSVDRREFISLAGGLSATGALADGLAVLIPPSLALAEEEPTRVGQGGSRSASPGEVQPMKTSLPTTPESFFAAIRTR